MPVAVAVLTMMLILSAAPTSAIAVEDLPRFVAQDLEGRTIDSSELKGNVVILNFWASWCSPCRKEMPALQLLYRKYKDKGLTIIGISVDDSADAVRKFLASLVVQYPILMFTPVLERLLGPADAVPKTLIFDRTGKLSAHRVGYADRDWYESRIRKLLTERTSE